MDIIRQVYYHDIGTPVWSAVKTYVNIIGEFTFIIFINNYLFIIDILIIKTNYYYYAETRVWSFFCKLPLVFNCHCHTYIYIIVWKRDHASALNFTTTKNGKDFFTLSSGHNLVKILIFSPDYIYTKPTHIDQSTTY